MKHKRIRAVAMNRLRVCGLLLTGIVFMVLFATRPALAQHQASSIARVDISGTESLPQFGERPVRRLFGTVSGMLRADESIAGLRGLAGGREMIPYTAAFELIGPASVRSGDVVIVEAENRGKPIFLSLLAEFAPSGDGDPRRSAYPNGLGNGFPFRQDMSYARVQWQVGISPDVPATAQGLGEAIMRDFGRLLAGRPHAGVPLPAFGHRILIGASQSAWFVNAFIAEGFNRDPATGRAVFQGAFTRNGSGNLLAINTAARGGAQDPYVVPDGVPIAPQELLRRPGSDPVLVDAASYTDFYRLRAGLFASAPGIRGLWRFDLAAPHAPAGPASAAAAFSTLRCNGGQAVPLDGTRDAPYLRALLVGLARTIGADVPGTGRLPRSEQFRLVQAPPGIRINALPGTRLMVPADGANGMPEGGVRTLEAELPLGRPVGGALPPVSTASIVAVCGNFAEWRPFTPEELTHRYKTRETYMQRASAVADHLVADSLLLPQDREPLLLALADTVAKAGLR